MSHHCLFFSRIPGAFLLHPFSTRAYTQLLLGGLSQFHLTTAWFKLSLVFSTSSLNPTIPANLVVLADHLDGFSLIFFLYSLCISSNSIVNPRRPTSLVGVAHLLHHINPDFFCILRTFRPNFVSAQAQRHAQSVNSRNLNSWLFFSHLNSQQTSHNFGWTGQPFPCLRTPDFWWKSPYISS